MKLTTTTTENNNNNNNNNNSSSSIKVSQIKTFLHIIFKMINKGYAHPFPMYICLLVCVYARILALRFMLRKYSLSRKFIPRPTDNKKAMAGDTSTELLFLDTFKHQNAEVKFLTPYHSLV